MHLNHTTVIYFFALVAAVILHEISHGVVALLLGDDTARRAGRLTLNPISHIDLFGSIILPAMGALSGAPVVGYAKPVPVDPRKLRNQRRDMLLVSLAGPATNLLLMLGSAFVARRLFEHSHTQAFFVSDLPLPIQIALAFALVNLLLGLFNLVPLPPLDGAALLERVLPGKWLEGWYKFRPYGLLVIILLVFSGFLQRHFFDPLASHLYSWVLR